MKTLLCVVLFSVSALAQTKTTSATLPALAGTVKDNVAATRCEYQNDRAPGFKAMTLKSGVFSASSIPLVIGINIFTVRCFDAAGNIGRDSVSVIRETALPAAPSGIRVIKG